HRAARNGRRADLATSRELERLAPKIERLLHWAVRKAEQHRLFVRFEVVWQPGRAHEHVPGSKDQRLACNTAAAITFDHRIYRGVARAIGLPLESLGQELQEGTDGRHCPAARHGVRILQL